LWHNEKGVMKVVERWTARCMNNHLTIQKGGRLVQNMNWEKANLTNNRYRRPTSQNVRLVYFIRKGLDLHYSTIVWFRSIIISAYIVLNTNLATLVVKKFMHLLGNFTFAVSLNKIWPLFSNDDYVSWHSTHNFWP